MEQTAAGSPLSSAHGEKHANRDLSGTAWRTQSADVSGPGPGSFSLVFAGPGGTSGDPAGGRGKSGGTAGCAVPFLMHHGMPPCALSSVIRWIGSAPGS